MPRMKKIATDTVKAVYQTIDPNKRNLTFELFGYDFMIDEEFNVWLIEVNTNPCLDLSCSFLARIIPSLLESTIKYFYILTLSGLPLIHISLPHQIQRNIWSQTQVISSLSKSSMKAPMQPNSETSICSVCYFTNQLEENMIDIIEEEEEENEKTEEVANSV